jgi:hypothetical protein
MMTTYLNTRVFDNGLQILTDEVDELRICSAAPTTYAEAHTPYSLGVKADPVIGAPAARSGGGRKVVMSAIEAGDPGDVTASGTATHYALCDTVNSRLLAVAAIGASQVVTDGSTFTSGTLEIGLIPPA